MSKDGSDDLERVLSAAGQCDLSRAVFSEELSAVKMDDSNGEFAATVDKLRFRQVVEVVTTLLKANGYTVNLENMLACLDEFSLGLWVKLVPRSVHRATPVAKSYAPCIRLRLPAKERVGSLLEAFYGEIEAYEAEIARLQALAYGKGDDNSEASPASLRRELQQAKQENQGLQGKISELAATVSQLQRSHADAARALAAQNLLPANVRMAIVRAVDFNTRHVALRAGRASLEVPLANFVAIPVVGQHCFVTTHSKHVHGVFLFDHPGLAPECRLGHVLHVAAETCKLRDDGRRTWLFEAQNPTERALVLSLHRGDRLIVYLYDGQIVRMEAVQEPSPEILSQLVLEAMARRQAASADTGVDASGKAPELGATPETEA